MRLRIDRLVVAGDQAVGCVVRRAQAIDVQLLLEEATDITGIARYIGRCCAGGAPHGIILQALAGTAPGFEACLQVVVRNRWQGFPGGADIGRHGVGFFGLRLRGRGVTAVASGEQRDHWQGPRQSAVPGVQ